MIPAQLVSDVKALAAAVTVNAPLNRLPQYQLTILQTQAEAVVVEVQADLAAAAGQLDAGDPTGYVGTFVTDLLALAEASADQSILCNVQGYVGRACFNINQVLA